MAKAVGMIDAGTPALRGPYKLNFNSFARIFGVWFTSINATQSLVMPQFEFFLR